MISKLLLTVVLIFTPTLPSAAQSFKATSLGDAASIGSDLSQPITLQLELDFTGTESIEELVEYLDTQGFALQINYHLKKGGDPTLMEKRTLQASRTGIFTAPQLDKLDAAIKRLTPSFDDRKARWRFNQRSS